MIENYCPFMEGLENVITKLWILPFICHREQISISTQSYWFQTLRDNISGNLCGILLNSTKAASQRWAVKVFLLVFSVISLYANKYPTLRPVFKVA